MGSATVLGTNRVRNMLRDHLLSYRRAAGEVYALVYLVDAKGPDGSEDPSFRPGYIATVWPRTSVSANWLLGTLPGGTEFYFLPRERWGEAGRFLLDVVDSSVVVFSLVRQ